MAVLQYGAVVTEIKGSLGGHTFKKQGSSYVIQMKSPGFSKSKQLLNPALGYAGFIFQQWIQLPDTSKEAWNNEALLVTFKDKFGNDVSISGRDLFTKLNLHLGVNYYMDVPPPGFTSAVDAFVISGGNFVTDPQQADVSIVVDSESFSYFDVTAELSVNRLRSPVFRTRMLLKRQILASNGTINFTSEFFSRFAYAQSGYFVRYYVTVLNPFGFKGLTQVIDLNEGVIIPSYTIVSASVTDTGNVSVIQLDTTVITGYLVNVYARVSSSSYPSDDFGAATNLGLFAKDGSDQLLLEDALKIAFPLVDTDWYVRFYTVLNAGGDNVGVPQTITTRVSLPVPDLILDSLNIDAEFESAMLFWEFDSVEEYTGYIYVLTSSSGIPADNFAAAQFCGFIFLASSTSEDIWLMLDSAGVDLSTGTGIRLYVERHLAGTSYPPPEQITTTVVGLISDFVLTGLTVRFFPDIERVSYTGTFALNYTLRLYASYTTGSTPPDNFAGATELGYFDYEADGTTELFGAIKSAFPALSVGYAVRLWAQLYHIGTPVGTRQTVTTLITS